jgi:circadian clock protein KaiB
MLTLAVSSVKEERMVRMAARVKEKKQTKVKRTNSDFWELRLYIAGNTSTSEQTIENLEEICETNLQGRYSIEVIDLLKYPKLAKQEQIFAIPTLVRKLPPPLRKIIGDLSNTEETLVGLDLRPVKSR